MFAWGGSKGLSNAISFWSHLQRVDLSLGFLVSQCAEVLFATERASRRRLPPLVEAGAAVVVTATVGELWLAQHPRANQAEELLAWVDFHERTVVPAEARVWGVHGWWASGASVRRTAAGCHLTRIHGRFKFPTTRAGMRTCICAVTVRYAACAHAQRLGCDDIMESILLL